MRINSFASVPASLILMVGISAGFLLTRPAVRVEYASTPMFMVGEAALNRADTAAKPLRVERGEGKNRALKRAGEALVPTGPAAPVPVVPPAVAYAVLPQYPLSALEREQEGVTVLSIFVGSGGDPDEIEVKHSSGQAEFDASAKTAAAKWKFNPATRGGLAIASWFEVPIRFKLQ